MNTPAGTTKLVIALALAGSLGLAVQAFADAKHKDDHHRKDKPPITLTIEKAGHVSKPDKFISVASNKADSFDFYVFASENDLNPKRYQKGRGGKVWLSHHKISSHRHMISTGPQVTQRLYFNSASDLESVVDTMD